MEVSGQLHVSAALPPEKVPPGKLPRYPLDRRLRGPLSRNGRGGEKKKNPSWVWPISKGYPASGLDRLTKLLIAINPETIRTGNLPNTSKPVRDTDKLQSNWTTVRPHVCIPLYILYIIHIICTNYVIYIIQYILSLVVVINC